MRTHCHLQRRQNQASKGYRFRDGAMSLEPLESRDLFSVAPLYYSMTGAGNNMLHPTWGMPAPICCGAILPASYGDGVSHYERSKSSQRARHQQCRGLANRRPPRSARSVRVHVCLGTVHRSRPGSHARRRHVRTHRGAQSAIRNSTRIQSACQTLPFTRSVTDPTTGVVTSHAPGDPAQSATVITSFLDGSMVYGSDPTRAAALRTFQGGQLKTSAGDLLPFNTGRIAERQQRPLSRLDDVSGRRHPRQRKHRAHVAANPVHARAQLAGQSPCRKQHPTWTDEQLYQGARQIVIAEIQSITYNEFLPALLGTGAITPYTGYKRERQPGHHAGVFRGGLPLRPQPARRRRSIPQQQWHQLCLHVHVA